MVSPGSRGTGTVKRAPQILVLISVLGASFSLCRAEDPSADASSMLKVPTAEARPSGDDGLAESPAPSPSTEATPVAEESPAPEETAIETGDSVVLPPFPLSRYQQLWERSPFQLESVAPPVESAGLAQRFALTGIAQINGEPIAFLMDRATQNRMMVKKDPNEAGLSLVQVDVPEKYNESTATIRQGAEVGTVRFDAAPGGPAMPPPAIPQPRPMPPGFPQAAIQPPMPVPGNVPQAPAVAPGVVPPVPGPPIPPNGQVQSDAGQMPPPRVIRRRALIPAAP